MRHYFIPTRIAIIEKTGNNWKDRQRQLLARMWGNWNPPMLLMGYKMVQSLCKTVWQFFRKLNIVAIWLSILPFLPEKIESISSHKNLHVSVHNSISNNPQIETSQMYINWWMDKQNVHMYDGMVSIQQHGWILKNIILSRSNIKDFVEYGPTYMK